MKKIIAIILLLSLSTCVYAGNLKVYPNPFKPGSGHTIITFDNLVPTASIRIYSVTGKLVWEKLNISSAQQTWDASNSSSQKVAAGVYFYVITNTADGTIASTGKIGIAR